MGEKNPGSMRKEDRKTHIGKTSPSANTRVMIILGKSHQWMTKSGEHRGVTRPLLALGHFPRTHLLAMQGSRGFVEEKT